MATPNEGDTRYNSVTGSPEVYQNGQWTSNPTPSGGTPATADTSGGAAVPDGSHLKVVQAPGGRYLIIGSDILGNETLAGSYADPAAAAAASGTNDHLTAAIDSLNSFLQAQSLADARRLNAFQTWQNLAQYALPKGATTAPGYEVGGPANAFAAQIGLKQYSPPPVTPAHVDPSQLGAPAPVPPEVMQMIGAIKGAA